MDMQAEFIGRARELEILEEEYSRNTAFVIVTGRRRVGKTRLINRFIEKKNSMYFLASRATTRDLLDMFSASCSEFFGHKFKKFRDWTAAFKAFADNITEKTVLVMDEFSFLMAADEGFLIEFKGIVDQILQGKPVMLIVCGSYISVMKGITDRVNSPLYGRFTRRLTILPLKFDEVRGNMDYRRAVEEYAVLGGVPKYMELFDKPSLRENVVRIVFDSTSIMFEDPLILLKGEVDESASYASILGAISGGAVSISKIASRLEIPVKKLEPYLEKLTDMGVIRRVVPVTENDPWLSKLGAYAVTDNFTAFWFRFVRPYYSELAMGYSVRALANFDRRFREAHVSFVFEEICRNRTRTMYDVIGFLPDVVGGYRVKDVEVDVMALNRSEKKVFAAECKYKDEEPVGMDVLTDLKAKVGMIRELEGYDVVYGLFSVTGFSDAVMDEKGLILVNLGEPVKTR